MTKFSLLRSYGFSDKDIELSKLIANLPENEFGEYIARVKSSGKELTSSGIHRFAKRYFNEAHDLNLVYFIQADIGGPIKIGVSANIDKRIAQLQLSCPFTLRLLLLVQGGYSVELKLHKLFHTSRLHGEWFEPSESLVKFITEMNNE